MEDRDVEDKRVGGGLSRFSKYNRAQRRQLARVRSALLGEPITIKEPAGRKYGLLVFKEEEHDEDGVMRCRLVHDFYRWYSSRKRRDDAYPHMARKHQLVRKVFKEHHHIFIT